MADDALTVAKEITLALLPRLGGLQSGEPETMGENAGKLFTRVLKKVVEGINEAAKSKGGLPTSSSQRPQATP